MGRLAWRRNKDGVSRIHDVDTDRERHLAWAEGAEHYAGDATAHVTGEPRETAERRSDEAESESGADRSADEGEDRTGDDNDGGPAKRTARTGRDAVSGRGRTP